MGGIPLVDFKQWSVEEYETIKSINIAYGLIEAEDKLDNITIPEKAKPEDKARIQSYKMQLIKRVDQFKKYLNGTE